jgi:hypothetical protein
MQDDFVYNPDSGPPRLLRFVDASQMPSPNTVAILIAKDNLVLINHHLFEQLDPEAQEKVRRTRLSFVEVDF